MNLDLLARLSEAAGPPGGEGPVRDILREHLKDRVDELRVDPVGNLFALKRAASPRSDGAPRVLVTAHMDEAGLMVVQIGDNGLLKVRAAGRIDPRGLLAQTLHIGSQRAPGVVGLAPVHLTSAESRENIPDLDDLAVDIGVDSKDAAQGVVKRGDYAVYATRFGQVGRFIKGKALDNRAGVAVLAALLEGDVPCDLHAVFTVQEGVGARGARVAAHHVRPDVAYVVDTVAVDELPADDDDEPRPTPRLGGGPVIVLGGQRTPPDRRLTQRLLDTAQASDIPVQIAATVGAEGDLRWISGTGTGVPTALLGLPGRYPHTAVTLMDPADLDAAVRLLRAILVNH